jgi:MacB-like periplasmic core domain
VPPNYFALIGANPQLGRSFNPEDHTPGFTLECLISDGLWKRAFGADPQVLGRSIRLDNDLYQIIGVMPAGYHDPGRTTEERNIELWAATGFAGAPASLPQRNLRILPDAIARITPGLTVKTAQSRLDALVASLQKQFPVDYPEQSAWRVRLVPLQETVVGNACRSLILLLGAVGLVLLIWVRERCKSASCSLQRQRARNGCSPGAGSGAKAAHVATADRRLASFSGGRDRRTGDSLLHQRILGATGAGRPATAQRHID